MTAWDKNAEVAGTFEVLGTNMGRIILAVHDENLRSTSTGTGAGTANAARSNAGAMTFIDSSGAHSTSEKAAHPTT